MKRIPQVVQPPLWYTHINKQVIAQNIHADEPQPPIRVQRGKSGDVKYGFRVKLPPGSEIISETKNRILACGARVVITSPSEPEIVE